jgi:hypothetical protein
VGEICRVYTRHEFVRRGGLAVAARLEADFWQMAFAVSG